jgi:guanylate kinase
MEIKLGIIAIGGASGSGKTTIAKMLLSKLPHHLSFSVSATTRTKRFNEVHGVDYYFMDEGEFLERKRKKEFLEHVGSKDSQSGDYYGTLHSEIERIQKLQRFVLLDVDLAGLESIKEIHPKESCCIYISATNTDRHLRLVERGNKKNLNDFLKRLDEGDIQEEIAKTVAYRQVLDLWVLNEDGKLNETFNSVFQKVNEFIEPRIGITALNGI